MEQGFYHKLANEEVHTDMTLILESLTMFRTVQTIAILPSFFCRETANQILEEITSQKSQLESEKSELQKQLDDSQAHRNNLQRQVSGMLLTCVQDPIEGAVMTAFCVLWVHPTK